MRVAARAKTGPGRARWAARLVGAGLTTATALGIAAGPALADPGPPSNPGMIQPAEVGDNPDVSCAPGETGFRVENPSTGSVNIPGDGSLDIIVSNTDQGQVFSFFIPDAAQRAATKVVAKGGNIGANVYTYPSPGSTADGFLHTPINPSGKFADLSHIDFCVVPCP